MLTNSQSSIPKQILVGVAWAGIIVSVFFIFFYVYFGFFFTECRSGCNNSALRRVSDLANIQLALEGYRNTTQVYPLQLQDLVPIYIDSIPTDPQTHNQYEYIAQGNKYTLCATFQESFGKYYPKGRDCLGSDVNEARTQNENPTSSELAVSNRIAQNQNFQLLIKIDFNTEEFRNKSDEAFINKKFYISKNNKNILLAGKILPNIDAGSFKLKDRDYGYTYATDKNFVYFISEPVSLGTNSYSEVYILPGADPKTFTLFSDQFYDYVHDAHSVFWLFTKISDDSKNFRKLPFWRFFIDSKDVYVDGKALGVDAPTFRQATGSKRDDIEYFEDKNGIYFFFDDSNNSDPHVSKLIEADTASFIYLGDLYAKDKTSVYSFGNKIIGADAATFELLQYGYARDKAAVYKGSQKVLGADPKTFIAQKPNRPPCTEC